jgi:hypothetical protein
MRDQNSDCISEEYGLKTFIPPSSTDDNESTEILFVLRFDPIVAGSVYVGPFSCVGCFSMPRDLDVTREKSRDVRVSIGSTASKFDLMVMPSKFEHNSSKILH